MPKFDTATEIEQIVFQMRLAEYPRALNRANIDRLFNGAPPYTPEEALANNISTNVNFLEPTKIAHDARQQFQTGLLSPDPLFTVSLDYGPTYRRREWASKITRALSRRINNQPFREQSDSEIATLVLHGASPGMWTDQETWCPESLGIGDVFVPANTLRSMKNLPMFAVYRQYTAMQLRQMTSGPHVDPGWNMPMVESCLEWVDQKARQLMGTQWPEVWSPERMEERIKGDGGLYASDAIPTINAYDFYFWDDDGKASGWNRRMILDAWGDAGIAPGTTAPSMDRNSDFDFSKGQFLFDPGTRKYADKLGNIMHWQFADCSSVAPFRYHSVRSLGFLLYAVCHLQNRLRCKFHDATFESLMQYFRVHNPEDAERTVKINLIDKGVIDEGVEFVKPEERWKIEQALVQTCMEGNRQTMADNSASFIQDFNLGDRQQEETATRTMAKVNATAAMTGAMLNQAYGYKKEQYREICRRFCVANSKDADVRAFRLDCLSGGVPEEALNAERWDVQPTRVVGNGNKMLQVAIADKLMAIRPQLDPEAQKKVDRLYIAANSDDYNLAEDLVPEQPHISDSIHDAELAFGAMMGGTPITPKPGLNPAEVAGRVLQLMTNKVQGILQSGGIGAPEDVQGLQLAEQYVTAFIQMLAADEREKPLVKELGDGLGKLMNEVKGIAQRQQEAAQAAQPAHNKVIESMSYKDAPPDIQRQIEAQAGLQPSQQGANGAPDPAAAAKAQAITQTANTKTELSRASHAQKTAQDQVAFEQKLRQGQQEHVIGLHQDAQAHALSLAQQEQQIALDAKAAKEQENNSVDKSAE